MDYQGYTAFKAETTVADDKGFENDIENQRNWNDAVIGIQEIK